MAENILKKLAYKARADDLLTNVCNKLKQDFGLTTCIGIEIEFYLQNDDISGSPITIKKEKGLYQYELDLPPLGDPSLAVIAVESAKKTLAKWRPEINFHPKPFATDYGSAMHFHINLVSGAANYYDDMERLEAGARALCYYLRQTFLVFAPDETHYARFDGKMMAPSRVAYGGNNRSVTIRIPDAKPYRLEHRVASPMTDPYLALFTIIKSLYLGLKNPEVIGNYAKIYGNAYDDQYDLEKLPRNLEEAMVIFDEGFYTSTLA